MTSWSLTGTRRLQQELRVGKPENLQPATIERRFPDCDARPLRQRAGRPRDDR
jgi:hypothetical protein